MQLLLNMKNVTKLTSKSLSSQPPLLRLGGPIPKWLTRLTSLFKFCKVLDMIKDSLISMFHQKMKIILKKQDLDQMLLQALQLAQLSMSSSLRSFQKPKLWVELENRLFKMKFLTFSKTTLSISLPWCSDLPFSFPPFTFVSQLYSLHAFLCSSPLHCSFSQ